MASRTLLLLGIIGTLLTLLNMQSCDENGCLVPYSCHFVYDFPVDYQMGDGRDTFRVGDTIDFHYEIPYNLADIHTGQEFDVRDAMDLATELWFCTPDFENNIFNNPRPGDFTVFDQLPGDTLLTTSNSFKEVHFMYRQKLEDREVGYLKIIPQRADNYVLLTALLFEKYAFYEDARVNWQDTCCSESAFFRHLANGGDNNMEIFVDTTAWGLPKDAKYGWDFFWEGHGPYYFTVVE